MNLDEEPVIIGLLILPNRPKKYWWSGIRLWMGNISRIGRNMQSIRSHIPEERNRGSINPRSFAPNGA